MACYRRRWESARVVDADPATRVLSVTFPGYNDIVRLGQARWELKQSSASTSALGKRERDTLDDGSDARKECEDLSEHERAMLQRCDAVRRRVAEAQEPAAAPIPGAPLDEANRGHRLLQRMGWSPGEGLGATEGRVRPVSEELKPHDGRAGLRAPHERPARPAPRPARPHPADHRRWLQAGGTSTSGPARDAERQYRGHDRG